MTHWWIIDYRQPENLQAFPEWLEKLDCLSPEDRPEHLLLLGCTSQVAIDIRKTLGTMSDKIKVHTLLKPRLEAFNEVPASWLSLCLNRLLQKNGATSAEIRPASTAGIFALNPGQEPFSCQHSVGSGNPKKPALAFVSPLPPSQTGISVYSESLLRHLGACYDLTLVVEKLPPKLHGSLQEIPWLTAESFRRRASDYERIVYQVGNSLYHTWQFDLIREHPGVVVLHDYYLYDAVWWQEKAGIKSHALRYSLYSNHGYAAVAALDASSQGRGPEEYPVNGEIVNEAAGLVVHSQHAFQLHRYWYPDHRIEHVSVIPHLRDLPRKHDASAARRLLRISDDTLVIASFGGMNPKKGVDRILEAFLDVAFKPPMDLLLVFAGAEHTGAFGAKIRQTLKAHPRGNRVKITGYLPDDAYRAWLQAADIAVQLRTTTRGETSGAVLDVMAYGLPLITNAHGSNHELPQHAVYMLPEDLTPAMLQAAILELAASRTARLRLGRNAQVWIRHHHSPGKIVELYCQAIEKSLKHPIMRQKQWLDCLAAEAEGCNLTHGQLENISLSIQQLQLLHQGNRPRILIDITILAWHDQKTGIERVTREIAIQLLKNPPQGYRCELIRWQGDDFYLAVDWAAELLGLADAPGPNRPVEPCADDIYLSLEWAPPLLQKAVGVFMEMKALGVRFCFTVHDLLPLFLPHCFPEGTKQKMRAWFHRVAHLSDGLLCVSAHVAGTVADQLHQLSIQNRPGVACFHPGADFSVPPGTPMGVKEKRLLKKIDASPRPRLLIVGTIEPRKGHRQVLGAVERLWSRKQPVTLIFAGKAGRGVDSLIFRLEKHSQKHRRLFWCKAASDSLLEHLYRRADLLVAASMDEGFGLPLIEAAHHHLPILARDIPVFKEVAGSYALYFQTQTAAGLADDIASWIESWRAGHSQPVAPLSYNSWAESADQLKAAVFQALSPASPKCEQRNAKSKP